MSDINHEPARQIEPLPETQSAQCAQVLAIRALNDAFRSDPSNYVVTAGVAGRGAEFMARAAQLVREHCTFTEADDPFGEHDFGGFELDGERLFWKIDCYDRDLQFGSEDPADPARTRRVLTIMLAAEY